MFICKRCGQPIEDEIVSSRVEWCSSMRRLLILHDVQPEEYHRKCFIGAMMGARHRARPTQRVRRHLDLSEAAMS